MNLEYFIAKRIHLGGNNLKKISSPAIKIAITGIALGLATMILAVCIVIGFKKEITDSIIGFTSHIQVVNFDNNQSYETRPIQVTDSLLNSLKTKEGIKHVEVFATTQGIIKTDNDFQGIVLKGISKDYDWSFFKKHMIEGQIINSDSAANNSIIISQHIANKLNLKLGDSFLAYFIQESVKTRKFIISGIYSTSFTDYDKIFAIVDIKTIQKLNKWNEDQFSGIEIYINDFNQLDEITYNLRFDMMSIQDGQNAPLMVKSATEIKRDIFSWLPLLDTNVTVIIFLMIIVSGVTMISGLLILILERTNMIGILKAIGAKNTQIRKIFLYISSFLILKGMVWGNIIALTICLIQKQFGILKLDPTSYYISEVPIYLNIFYILLINIGVFLSAMLMMVGPSYLIAKISPAKSIKFE